MVCRKKIFLKTASNNNLFVLTTKVPTCIYFFTACVGQKRIKLILKEKKKMAMKRTPSLSSLPPLSTRAMITFFILFIGTLSEILFGKANASWPIVRYKNGTVWWHSSSTEHQFTCRRKLERFGKFIRTRSRSRGVRRESLES